MAAVNEVFDMTTSERFAYVLRLPPNLLAAHAHDPVRHVRTRIPTRLEAQIPESIGHVTLQSVDPGDR